MCATKDMAPPFKVRSSHFGIAMKHPSGQGGRGRVQDNLKAMFR